MKLFASLVMVMVAGCAAAGSAPKGEDAGSSEAATAKKIDAALAGAHRSEANKARDAHRHPKETLLFFGLRDDMSVVEIWPGGGWYTEVLAPVLKERGKYYAAHLAPNPDNAGVTRSLGAYRQKLDDNAPVYGGVVVTALGAGATEIAPPESADLVLTFRNIHNWMARDFATDAFAAAFRALKPGGILGVVEHRGDPAVAQDPKAKNGYVNEQFAIEMIEAAGFELVGRSEINANPRDTKDYASGVWTLPPTFALKDQDRERYAAIGESDRFTLKFRKPGGAERPARTD